MGRRGPGAPRVPSRAVTTSRGRANGPASSPRPAPRSRGGPVPRTAPESRSGTFGRIRTGRIRSGPPLLRSPHHREPAPGTPVCREYPGQVVTPAPAEAPGRPSHPGRQHPDIRPDNPSRREWPDQGVTVRLDLATWAVPVTSADPATGTRPAISASAATRAPPRICAGPAIWAGGQRRRVAPAARGRPTHTTWQGAAARRVLIPLPSIRPARTQTAGTQTAGTRTAGTRRARTRKSRTRAARIRTVADRPRRTRVSRFRAVPARQADTAQRPDMDQVLRAGRARPTGPGQQTATGTRRMRATGVRQTRPTRPTGAGRPMAAPA